MPRLKLGGQRPPSPRYNGILHMMGMGGAPGFQNSPRAPMMNPLNQMLAHSQPQPQPMGLPVIAGTMSLKQLRPKAPVLPISPRAMTPTSQHSMSPSFPTSQPSPRSPLHI